MKNLSNFIYEAKKADAAGEAELKEVVGKTPRQNVRKSKNSDLEWAVDEPTNNDAVAPLDKTRLNRNMKRLLSKFKAEEDFFILGRAGWGKTSIIKNLAKRYGRYVVTVYLDKAQKEDLGGIPVAVKGKSGIAYQEMALPEWAALMQANPDKKFLLFFDEMNQADPDIMNALMPIVLEHSVGKVKFDNFFVGAAGNFADENDAVNELSGPLKSRFKPLIVWETGGDNWNQVFDYLHNKWDDKVGADIINTLDKYRELFDNPRELEDKVVKWMYKLKGDEDLDIWDVDDYADRLERTCKEELSRTEETDLKKLAEEMYNYMNNLNTVSSGRSKRSKDINMVPENIRAHIKHGMEYGFIKDNDGTKYGVSQENIRSIDFDEDDCNAEMLDRIINKFEADGVKWKFKKDSEWKKAGYKDPNGDE